jgi:ribosomal protein S18 acetylase RimI-like enzyme
MQKDNLEIRIRRAGAADLDSVTAFNQAMALETEGKSLDSATLSDGVRSALENVGLGFYVLAEVAGRVVGQLLITTEWSDWRNGYFWWIQSVYVDPGYRRQGVYRTLYDYVVSGARRAGDVRGIRLYVDRDNTIAKETYHTLGMTHSHYDMYEVEFG